MSKVAENKTVEKDLILSMMECDGRAINCEGCAFREHPDCRDAMARHGAAMINLQDVVNRNTAAMLAKVKNDRENAIATAHDINKRCTDISEVLGRILDGLRESRHCDSCGTLKDGADHQASEARCKACREGESLWYLDEGFGAPPKAEEIAKAVEAEPDEAREE